MSRHRGMRAMLADYDDGLDDEYEEDYGNSPPEQSGEYIFSRPEDGTEISQYYQPQELPGPLPPPSPGLCASASVATGLSKLENIPDLGSKVTAQYTADGNWYSAKVTAIIPLGDGHSLFRVMYEGYGNEEDLTLDQIRIARKATSKSAKKPRNPNPLDLGALRRGEFSEKGVKRTNLETKFALPPPSITKSRSVPGKLGKKRGEAKSLLSRNKSLDNRNGNKSPNSRKTPKTPQPKEKELKLKRNNTPSKLLSYTPSKKQLERKKNLLQTAETKSRKPGINLVVIGHVDAGKSTLMGHFLVEIGRIDKKTLRKYQKESAIIGKSSFAFAWILDGHEEERQRGITVDVAVSHFETEKRTVTLLDAPGHKDFIANMISGAAQADAAVLVVPAKVGEFETSFKRGGQTKEHAILIRSLGVRNIILAVNKLDLVGWNEDRYKEVCRSVIGYLRTLGYKKQQITSVPVSGLLGENLVKRSNIDLTRWYGGPTLAQAIDQTPPPKRPVEEPFLMLISDVFKHPTGGGMILAGKIQSGCVIAKDKILVLPASICITVKAITSQGKPVDVGRAGDNVEINCKDVDEDMAISVGQVICEPSKPVQFISEFKAKVMTLNFKIPLLAGQNVIVYSVGVGQPAHIHELTCQIDRKTGEVVRNKPRCIPRNSAGEIVFRTKEPICLEKFLDKSAIGRVSIRRGEETVCFGVVVSTVKQISRR